MNEPDQLAATTNTLASRLMQWLDPLLSSLGVPESFLEVTRLILIATFIVLVVAILLYVSKKIFVFVIGRAYKITNIKFLYYLKINKLPYYAALIVPYTFVRNTIPILFSDYPSFISPFIKLTNIYLVLLSIWAILSFIKSFFNVLQERPSFANKPMQSYVQIIAIILYILGAIVVVAIITSQSLGVILGTLGAASAVMMLVFQDSIKGFVGSVQMSTNDIVALGDWITMSKYGADGVVEEVTLNSVKVQNFDKTITTIPTYALISDSFQNWRGMQESGGRRFRKCIFVKQRSIRFMSENELTKFRAVDYLNEAIQEKEKQYSNFDRMLIDNCSPVTNNDLFMAYAMHYLKSHPRIAQDKTLLVRQLAPTTTGVPVEVYVFTATTVWAEYEEIATDVMNHLFAMVNTFDLQLFELASDTPQNS